MGFQLYLFLRSKYPKSDRRREQDAWILVGCIFGALIGSKVLAWMERHPFIGRFGISPISGLEGKTIVGGLLGGWAGIEIAKKAIGVAGSVGDACVLHLMTGMCIGRMGCFLTGLSDNTCGIATHLPWGDRLR